METQEVSQTFPPSGKVADSQPPSTSTPLDSGKHTRPKPEPAHSPIARSSTLFLPPYWENMQIPRQTLGTPRAAKRELSPTTSPTDSPEHKVLVIGKVGSMDTDTPLRPNKGAKRKQANWSNNSLSGSPLRKERCGYESDSSVEYSGSPYASPNPYTALNYLNGAELNKGDSGEDMDLPPPPAPTPPPAFQDQMEQPQTSSSSNTTEGFMYFTFSLVGNFFCEATAKALSGAFFKHLGSTCDVFRPTRALGPCFIVRDGLVKKAKSFEPANYSFLPHFIKRIDNYLPHTTSFKKRKELKQTTSKNQTEKCTSKGIIEYNIGHPINEIKNLFDFGRNKIESIRRITDKFGKETRNLIVTFATKVAPLNLIGNLYSPLEVKPCLFNLKRCNCCQRFGHLYQACKSTFIACPHCAEPHTHAQCTVKHIPAALKCANCKGNHKASDDTCPIYQKYETIIKQKNETLKQEWEARKTAQKKTKSKPSTKKTKPVTPPIIIDSPVKVQNQQQTYVTYEQPEKKLISVEDLKRVIKGIFEHGNLEKLINMNVEELDKTLNVMIFGKENPQAEPKLNQPEIKKETPTPVSNVERMEVKEENENHPAPVVPENPEADPELIHRDAQHNFIHHELENLANQPNETETDQPNAPSTNQIVRKLNKSAPKVLKNLSETQSDPRPSPNSSLVNPEQTFAEKTSLQKSNVGSSLQCNLSEIMDRNVHKTPNQKGYKKRATKNTVKQNELNKNCDSKIPQKINKTYSN